jgi:hypothetical protein
MYPVKVSSLMNAVRTTINAASVVRPSDSNEPRLRQFMAAKFRDVLDHCETLNMPVASKQARDAIRMITELGTPNSYDADSIQKMAQLVANTIETEIDLKLFYGIGAEHSNFMNTTCSFGDQTALRFESALYDIDEAGKCLALGRSTAAVFHLMRVMEISIRSMARCLNVPDPIRPAERNWGVMIRKLREAMDRLDKGTPRAWASPADRALFDDACAYLEGVRNAWRNATMHIENRYTEEEADNIFKSVRIFTRKLAVRMDEEGKPNA